MSRYNLKDCQECPILLICMAYGPPLYTDNSYNAWQCYCNTCGQVVHIRQVHADANMVIKVPKFQACAYISKGGNYICDECQEKEETGKHTFDMRRL